MQRDQRWDLVQYRLSMANEMLADARAELERESFKTANNRGYYAIFHAMRAILAIEGADFKHHSGVISYFGRSYIATGVFPKEFSDVIRNASLLRNGSDYDDFYICSKQDTISLVESATVFVEAVEHYLRSLESTNV